MKASKQERRGERRGEEYWRQRSGPSQGGREGGRECVCGTTRLLHQPPSFLPLFPCLLFYLRLLMSLCLALPAATVRGQAKSRRTLLLCPLNGMGACNHKKKQSKAKGEGKGKEGGEREGEREVLMEPPLTP
jgi:hypothetical protein